VDKEYNVLRLPCHLLPDTAPGRVLRLQVALAPDLEAARDSRLALLHRHLLGGL
jgi:hypothetical protein